MSAMQVSFYHTYIGFRIVEFLLLLLNFHLEDFLHLLFHLLHLLHVLPFLLLHLSERTPDTTLKKLPSKYNSLEQTTQANFPKFSMVKPPRLVTHLILIFHTAAFLCRKKYEMNTSNT